MEILEARQLFALTVSPFDPVHPATTLSDALVVPNSGITVTNVFYTGQNGQGGTFNGLHLIAGGEQLDLNDGVLLTNGLATSAAGAAGINADTYWNTAGDASAASLAGAGTHDANVLTIQFTADPGTESLSFELLYGSEEGGTIDPFGAFLDGVSVSFDASHRPITPDNAFFTLSNFGGADLAYDGLTRALRTSAPIVGPGTHTLKFVIVDSFDAIVDSGVFLSKLTGSIATVASPTTKLAVPEVGFSAAGQSVANTAGSASVIVTRAGDATAALNVHYATAAGTALEGTDYTGVSGTLSFAADETTKTITVPLIDRPGAAASQAFTVTLSGPSVGVLGTTTTQTVTVTNNRAPVEIAAASYAATTDDADVVVTLTRTGNTSLAAEVDYATSGGTAADGTDYTGVSGTLTFAAGQTSKTVTIPLAGNVGAGDGLTFDLTISNGAGGALLNGLTGTTVTISNSHAPVQFAAASYGATTDDGTVTLTVTRTGNTSLPVHVEYTTADGTAADGADYTGVSGTLLFLAGQTTATVEVPLLGNIDGEDGLAFDVTLSTPTGGATLGGTTTSTVTVANSHAPLTLSAATYAASTDDASVVLTVTRSGNTSLEVDVDFATEDGTALDGTDYTATSGTLSFAAGETSKTVTVLLGSNMVAADGAAFTLTLSSPSIDAELGAISMATVEIENLHSVVQLASATYARDTADGSVTLTVTRTGNTALAGTVDFDTADGTAVDGTDYTAASGTISFAAGETSKTFTVSLLGNMAAADGAAFTVTLSAPAGGAVLGGTPAATVEIENLHSVVQVAAATYSADGADGSVTLTVTRTGNTALAGTVDFETTDGTALHGQDYTAASGTLSFAAGQTTRTITVTLSGDPSRPAGASFTLGLNNPAGGAVTGARNGATVTITNDRSAVTLAQSTHSVTGDDGSVVLTLTRTGNTANAASLSFATSDGTAHAGVDYTPASGTVSFAAGETSKDVTVLVRRNNAGAAASTFTVTLSGPATGTAIGGHASAVVTVQNLHSLVQFQSATTSASGDDGSVVLTVNRTGNTSLAATVGYHTVSGTAVAGNDFTSASGTITFAAGETQKTITVLLPGNPAAAALVGFDVALSGPGGSGVVGSTHTAAVSVSNVHSVISFSSATYSSPESAGLATITLTRTGNVSLPVGVKYAATAGTVSSADFTAAEGWVQFAAGESSRTFTVDVSADETLESGETVSLALVDARDGAVVGGQASAALTIDDSTIPAPVVMDNGFAPVPNAAGKLAGLELTFDLPLQSAPPVSAFALFLRSGDGPNGRATLKPVALDGATYDPTTRAVTVQPTRALKPNRFYQLVVDGSAVRSRDGHALDGAGTGEEGSEMVVNFGRGRKLKYVDHDGDVVRLKLTGPGMMELTRASDGEGDVLTLTGTTSATTLVGKVSRTRTAGDGHTGIASIVGLGDATDALPREMFDVTSVA